MFLHVLISTCVLSCCFAQPTPFPGATAVLTQEGVASAPMRFAGFLPQALLYLETSYPYETSQSSCEYEYALQCPADTAHRQFSLDASSVQVSLREEGGFQIEVGQLSILMRCPYRVYIGLCAHHCGIHFCHKECDSTATFSYSGPASLTAPISFNPSTNTMTVSGMLLDIDFDFGSDIDLDCHSTFSSYVKDYLEDRASQLKQDILAVASQKLQDAINAELNSPPPFPVVDGVVVGYQLTDVQWSATAVTLAAALAVSTQDGGFACQPPLVPDPDFALAPSQVWDTSGVLSGLRLSSTLWQCVNLAAGALGYWTYDMQNVTVEDAVLDFDMHWSAMQLAVTQTNQFNATIAEAALRVNCHNTTAPATSVSLANATMTALTATANVSWANSGFVQQLVSFDFSQFRVRITAPRLPLSPSWETQFMEHLLQSNVNDMNRVLAKSPFSLPSDLLQYYPNPVTQLVWQQGIHGYVESLSLASAASMVRRRDIPLPLSNNGSLAVSIFSETHCHFPAGSLLTMFVLPPGCSPYGGGWHLNSNGSLALFCNSSCGDCLQWYDGVALDTCLPGGDNSSVLVQAAGSAGVCVGGSSSVGADIIAAAAGVCSLPLQLLNYGQPDHCVSWGNSSWSIVSDTGLLRTGCNGNCSVCSRQSNVTQCPAQQCLSSTWASDSSSGDAHGLSPEVLSVFKWICIVLAVAVISVALIITLGYMLYLYASVCCSALSAAAASVAHFLATPPKPAKLRPVTLALTALTVAGFIALFVNMNSVFLPESDSEVRELGLTSQYVNMHKLEAVYRHWNWFSRWSCLASALGVAGVALLETFVVGGAADKKRGWLLFKLLILASVLLWLLLTYLLPPWIYGVQHSVQLRKNALNDSLTNNPDVQSGLAAYLRGNTVGFTYSFVCHLVVYVTAPMLTGAVVGVLGYGLDFMKRTDTHWFASVPVVNSGNVVSTLCTFIIPIALTYPLLVHWHTLNSDSLYMAGIGTALVTAILVTGLLVHGSGVAAKASADLLQSIRKAFYQRLDLLFVLLLVGSVTGYVLALVREAAVLQMLTLSLHNGQVCLTVTGLVGLLVSTVLRWMKLDRTEHDTGSPDTIQVRNKDPEMQDGECSRAVQCACAPCFLLKRGSDYLDSTDSHDTPPTREVLRRRTWLLMGLLLLTAVTAYRLHEAFTTSAWSSIEDLLQLADSSMSMPSEDSLVKPLADRDDLVTTASAVILAVCTAVLWLAFLVQSRCLVPSTVTTLRLSRVLVFLSLLLVLASVLLPSMQNYLQLLPVDKICAYCAAHFNWMLQLLVSNMVGTALAESQAMTSFFIQFGLVPALLRVCEFLLLERRCPALLLLFRLTPLLSFIMLGSGALFANLLGGDWISALLTAAFFLLPLLCTLTVGRSRVTPHYLLAMLTYVGSFLALAVYEAVKLDLLRQHWLSLLFSSASFYMLLVEIVAEWCIANVVVGDILCVVLVD